MVNIFTIDFRTQSSFHYASSKISNPLIGAILEIETNSFEKSVFLVILSLFFGNPSGIKTIFLKLYLDSIMDFFSNNETV